jgi:hypothetical protein
MDVKHDGSGVGVPVPEPLAFAGIAIDDTSVCGVPLSTVSEDPWRDHAHPVVTDRIDEYCSTSHVLGTRMGLVGRNHPWWSCAGYLPGLDLL